MLAPLFDERPFHILTVTEVTRDIKELLEDVGPGAGRVRREGGGRKKTVIKDPSLRDDLERMMAPTSLGNIESPLRWTYKSVRQLTEELKQMGHKTSHRMVAELLHELGYNLKVNRKTREDYADLEAQLEYINRTAQAHFAMCDPVISVEARKKGFVGEFRNGGREQSPQDNMEKMWEHDFLVSELGQVTPNDVYYLGHDHCSVGINVDHDMETFAVESIQHRHLGAAGRAPGRPEVHDDDPAAQRGQIEAPTIQLRNEQRGSRISHLGSAPRCDKRRGGQQQRRRAELQESP